MRAAAMPWKCRLAFLTPASLGSLLSDLRPTLAAECFGPRPAAPLTQRLSRLVLAVVGPEALLLHARGHAHDLDGVADHVGRALMAFGSSGHRCRGCSCLPASI